MSKKPSNLPSLPRDLGDGLILRRSTSADADGLAEFNSRIHGGEEPDTNIGVWTRDLLKGSHPTFAVDDFLIVERTSDGKIISSSNLISQIWTYGGIPFKVGRPELIGTEPDFRRRGLVRLQMDVLHAWSEARGEMVQAITGIPNYYRQFGYEMTVDMENGQYVHFIQKKPLEEGKTEPYSIRPAVAADIPVLQKSYNRGNGNAPLTCLRTDADWLYEMTGKDPQNVERVELFIIEDEDNQPVGALGVKSVMWGETLPVQFYGLLPGHSYLMVTPSVLRFLWEHGQEKMEEGKTCTRLLLLLGVKHPAYAALDPRTTSTLNPYAYFMRVADLPAFMRHITPVLEKRLEESPCDGHSGELRISFYRDGIQMKFEKGRIAEIGSFAAKDWEDGDAFFPDLTFLHLLFQSRSLDELRESYTDCMAKIDARALLNAMFPRSPSAVWVIS